MKINLQIVSMRLDSLVIGLYTTSGTYTIYRIGLYIEMVKKLLNLLLTKLSYLHKALV
jgi:hypothetical protein